MTCNRPSCSRPAYCTGMCTSHYNKRARAGLTRRVSPEQAIQHVLKLKHHGWTYADMYRASGVHVNTFSVLMGTGASGMVRRTRGEITNGTLNKILALPLTDRDNAVVPCVGVVRRSRALARMGWPLAVQAERIGLYQNTLRRIGSRPSETVSIRVHRAMCELYDELAMSEGPSGHASTLAKQKGWPSPLAWEDNDIDNPAATPILGGR